VEATYDEIERLWREKNDKERRKGGFKKLLQKQGKRGIENYVVKKGSIRGGHTRKIDQTPEPTDTCGWQKKRKKQEAKETV